MVQNVGRQVALIAILLITSLALILVPDKPLRMGLDLAGGTRLVYSFDIDAAREDGLVSSSETDDAIIQQQIGIIRNRIDPQGVKEPVLRKLGEGLLTANGGEGHLRFEGRTLIPAGASGHGRLLWSAK